MTRTNQEPPMTDDHDNDDPKGFAQMPRWLQRSEASANAKLVYLALSSRADKYGRSHPSHATLAKESSCSVPSVKRALAELRDTYNVVSWTRRNGLLGRSSNEYTIGIAARLPEPVDNSPRGADHGEPYPRGTDQGDPNDSSHRASNERKPVNELNQSSSTSHVGGVIHNHDDDEQNSPANNYPTPGQIFGRKGIDQPALAASVGHLFVDAAITDDELHAIAVEILAKASSHVTDPTQYVVASIRRDPIFWQRRAYEIVADRALQLAEAGGNPF